MESVFSAMVYFEKIKTAFLIKMTILSKSFVIMLKEMEIVINKELSTLEKVSIFYLLALEHLSSIFEQ